MLRRIGRQNLYISVIDQLKHYIIDNELQPGDRLPTESALVEQLGINRSAIREAIKVMDSMGIVQTRPRDGTRLMTLTMKPLAEHLQFLVSAETITIQEIADVRRILECGMMAMVVRNADEHDFRRMEAALSAQREDLQNRVQIIESDMEFHQALAAATKNRLMEEFGVIFREFFHRLRQTHSVYKELDWQTLETHECIFRALREGNADAAERLMSEHLLVYEQACKKTQAEETPRNAAAH